MLISLLDFMSKNVCTDPCRFYNSHSKEYSFLSETRQHFTWVDYYFIYSKLIIKVPTVKYHPAIISDHAQSFFRYPVFLINLLLNILEIQNIS